LRYSKLFFRFFLVTILIVLYSYLLGTLLKLCEEKVQVISFVNEVKKGKNSNYNPYLAVLEIPKINLKKGLYDISSPYNDVEKNIEVNKNSDMPSKENGNFILAAHSGFSFQSYFNKLENLTKNDEVILYYDDMKYIYNVDNFYDIPKTGRAIIKRDKTKNTITLITCKKNTEKQIVYIGYLKEKITY